MFGQQPPLGSLGAPLFPLSAQPPLGSLGAPLVPPSGFGGNLNLFGNRLPIGLQANRSVPFSDSSNRHEFDGVVVGNGDWGRASFDTHVDGGLGMGLGPVNPYGLQSSSLGQIGRGLATILGGGGLGGIINVALNEWARGRGGGTGRARHGASALGGLFGLPVNLGEAVYDIVTANQGNQGGG